MTWKRLHRCWKIDTSFRQIYEMNPAYLSNILRLSPGQSAHVYHHLHSISPLATYRAYEALGIQILTRFDDEYPERLLHIYDPPWILYAKGSVELLQRQRSLAVVGTRTPTDYGKKALHYLLPPLIKKKVLIVSGLARGIDTLAHHITLRSQGRTIAVLGSGFDYIYPRENTNLAMNIASHHLLLSEFPPSVPPQKWHFPMRNRLISGLSDITFIAEAGERSGSLITAYQALDQGKEVRALPGTIFSSMSKGTNHLIAEGADPVKSPHDLWHDHWTDK
ncbi:DNA-processing protein DprA [Bacillus piscicola]|uniref:DNA-processing protein DprA n=1 Tax=Bacillus piscicola TaxID=1632684 RepID=UPI001F089C05|nr:DNA-processing protein DprA [Bacillus piscicola]